MKFYILPTFFFTSTHIDSHINTQGHVQTYSDTEKQKLINPQNLIVSKNQA